ncbi:tyrosine-type recombinase/integrase [Gracilimonas sp. Q87]|uniref:tyrosine-type recombinase/integrase n=1 Tax=Gracilimonas sp. Q87 TaxID=3384766 RepID=UPI0039841709
MLNNNLDWLFFPRKDRKRKKDGKSQLYLRFKENGTIAKTKSLGLYVHYNDWDSDKQRLRKDSEDVKINEILSAVETRLQKEYQQCVVDQDVHAERLVKVIDEEDETVTLISIFEDHNNRMSNQIGKNFTVSTHKKYKTTLNHVRSFLKEIGKKDVDVTKISTPFLYNFEEYLKNNGCSQNTASKYLTHLRKVVYIAIKKGHKKDNPFIDYNFTYEKKSPKFLTGNELQRIQQKEFDIERLGYIKDLFLFACETGLSFSDLMSLKEEDIQEDSDGDQFIYTHRIKTGNGFTVPLSKSAKQLIEKYESLPTLLPTISNQKMNAYLKEIADLCKITKKLTSHVARHTFATQMITKGVALETVKEMLGHSRMSSTEIYAKVTPIKIKKEMRQAGFM